MGLFGGGDTPTLTLPQAPTFKTAQETLQTGVSFGKEQMPLALGAREAALQDILTPEAATQFFEGFQPTSFEEALAQQSFANIMPDIERSIKHNLSLSGMESSPILAEQIARERGRVGVDIGNILANLGQQRAMTSLTSRLGIDPLASIISPVAGFESSIDMAQKEMQFQRDLAQAMADFEAEQQKAAESGGLASTIGSLLGGTAGFFLGGGPAGAALGASLGGTAGGTLFGNSSSTTPISLADALAIGEGFGGNTASSVTPTTTQKTSNRVNLPEYTLGESFNFPSF